MILYLQFLRDLEEELHSLKLEEDTLRRRLCISPSIQLSNGHSTEVDLSVRLGDVQLSRLTLGELWTSLHPL